MRRETLWKVQISTTLVPRLYISIPVSIISSLLLHLTSQDLSQVELGESRAESKSQDLGKVNPSWHLHQTRKRSEPAAHFTQRSLNSVETCEAGSRAQGWVSGLHSLKMKEGFSLQTLNRYEIPVCPSSKNKSLGTQRGILSYWTWGHQVCIFLPPQSLIVSGQFSWNV